MEKSTIAAIIIAVATLCLFATPFGIVALNNYQYQMQKTYDQTSYYTKKQVEDTCRALIVSYQGDKVMYEEYKDSVSTEERSWANNAKIRANKTAITYNEFILKNSFVFEGNIPNDICMELPIIE